MDLQIGVLFFRWQLIKVVLSGLLAGSFPLAAKSAAAQGCIPKQKLYMGVYAAEFISSPFFKYFVQLGIYAQQKDFSVP